MSALGPVDHVARPRLPWRSAPHLTECGKDLARFDLVRIITTNALIARIRDLGRQRAAYTTCMTCWGAARRHRSDRPDPLRVISRELEPLRCSEDGPLGDQDDGLRRLSGPRRPAPGYGRRTPPPGAAREVRRARPHARVRPHVGARPMVGPGPPASRRGPDHATGAASCRCHTPGSVVGTASTAAPPRPSGAPARRAPPHRACPSPAPADSITVSSTPSTRRHTLVVRTPFLS